MKKFLVAAAVAATLFNFAETQAATVGVDKVEIAEMGLWTKFRDHITGRRAREKERERWERHHRYDYDRPRYRDDDYGRRPPPPPPPPPRRGRY